MVNGGPIWRSFRGDSAVARMERNAIRERSVRGQGPGLRSRSIPATESILRGKDPVAAGLQADDFAGLEFPVPGGVDLNHGLALTGRERNFRPLDRTERADMAHGALQRAGSGRPDLHVVAADEQL